MLVIPPQRGERRGRSDGTRDLGGSLVVGVGVVDEYPLDAAERGGVLVGNRLGWSCFECALDAYPPEGEGI